MTYLRKLLALLMSLIIFCLVIPPAVSGSERSALDSYITTFLEDHGVPGATVTILRNGEPYYSQEWGMSGGSEGKITHDTPFLLGSISKSFTGLAIFQLLEQGLIQLDDPVQRHIPWFTLEDEEAASRITIRELLSHTSGLSTYSGLLVADQGSSSVHAIKDNVKSLSTTRLSATPGTYQYSDANYLILGALIEEVTGQTYTKTLQENIFIPLGMDHASADHQSADRAGYQPGFRSWFGIPFKSALPYDNGGAPYGYISASSKDMEKYLKFIQGESELLSRERLEQFLSPLTQTRADRHYGYGWMFTDYKTANPMIWHSGSTPDSRTELFLLPDEGWSGVILTNRNHAMEEEDLAYLKEGIIQILRGEKPLQTQHTHSMIPFVLLGMVVIMLALIGQLLRGLMTLKEMRNRYWLIAGTLCMTTAVLIIPGISHFTSAPWRTVRLFAPDLAILIDILVWLIGFYGILALIVPIRGQLNRSPFSQSPHTNDDYQ